MHLIHNSILAWKWSCLILITQFPGKVEVKPFLIFNSETRHSLEVEEEEFFCSAVRRPFVPLASTVLQITYRIITLMSELWYF